MNNRFFYSWSLRFRMRRRTSMNWMMLGCRSERWLTISRYTFSSICGQASDIQTQFGARRRNHGQESNTNRYKKNEERRSPTRWPRSMSLTATSPSFSRWRISRATPKFPDPMSRTASYFSIPSLPPSAAQHRLPEAEAAGRRGKPNRPSGPLADTPPPHGRGYPSRGEEKKVGLRQKNKRRPKRASSGRAQASATQAGHHPPARIPGLTHTPQQRGVPPCPTGGRGGGGRRGEPHGTKLRRSTIPSSPGSSSIGSCSRWVPELSCIAYWFWIEQRRWFPSAVLSDSSLILIELRLWFRNPGGLVLAPGLIVCVCFRCVLIRFLQSRFSDQALPCIP